MRFGDERESSNFEDVTGRSGGGLGGGLGGGGLGCLIPLIASRFGIGGVVVLLVGTNNLPDGSDAAEIAQGIQAIVKVIQAKAPAATLLLTGIFPRLIVRPSGPMTSLALGTVLAATAGKSRRQALASVASAATGLPHRTP